MVDLTGNDQASACSVPWQIPGPHHRIVMFHDWPELLINARRHCKMKLRLLFIRQAMRAWKTLLGYMMPCPDCCMLECLPLKRVNLSRVCQSR